MAIPRRIRTIFRGDLSLANLSREAVRRQRAAVHRRRERRMIDQIETAPAHLLPEFAKLSADEFLRHFSGDREARFWPFAAAVPEALQKRLFHEDIDALIDRAKRIVRESAWEVAGFGFQRFDADNVWRRDPITGKDWGLDYHSDVVTFAGDGADIRILWEVNRFGHAVTLARAFLVTGDEAFANAFFSQVESWAGQNPYGRGANWTCAMEVALRGVNLLAALDIFRHSAACTPERLERLIALLGRHGTFIFDNNEFSYISTSNHYLSDVAGLFWLGTMLPELADAAKWRDFGLRELLSEMNKQVLADGADFESSTGYHRFVAELFLYTFVLADKYRAMIPQENRDKLKKMFSYLFAVTRPDGRMPLIGDADGAQFVPIVKRDANDAAHLLALAAVYFNEPEFKFSSECPPEVLWLFGEKGVERFDRLTQDDVSTNSTALRKAGAAILRNEDLYLHLNACDCGVNGRGSHAHNDALSIEVLCYGQEFIIDPGTYCYNLDRNARHDLRSTAYHSTVLVDGVEQNTIETDTPFVIGNEADPAILAFETSEDIDRAAAEHFGYGRLKEPITHRRMVEFEKAQGYWTIHDVLSGTGDHEFRFSFHIAPGTTVDLDDPKLVSICSDSGVRLHITSDLTSRPQISTAWRSLNYGHKEATQILSWHVSKTAPFTATFVLVPSERDNAAERLALIQALAINFGT